MALLEELLIRIGVDASGVDRGIDQSTKKTDNLTDSLKKTEGQATDTGAAFAGMAAKALGALTALLSVGNAISGAVTRAEMVGELSRTSEALGIAIEDLDAFGKAAERAGGDAQGARDSLTDMAEALGEALSDKESGRAKAFKALGIAITDTNGKAKDGLTGILDLASAVEGLDKSAAVFKVKELGITDNRTVELILKGRKELERMLAVQKAQGVVTKEAAERAKVFNENLYALRGATSNASNSFLDSLIPALTKVIGWLTKVVEWATEHKDAVVGFFIAVGAIVTAVYLPAMIAAAVATLAATWPLLLLIAAVGAVAAAFALVYDDIMNFVDGNDSFIGQIFEKYPMVQQIVMTLIDVFKAFWDTLMTGAAQIGGFVTAAFLQIVQGIKFAIDYLAEATGAFSQFSADVISVFDGIGATVKAVFASIVDIVKGSIGFVMDSINKVKSAGSSIAGFVGLGGGDEATPKNNTPLTSGSGQDPLDVPGNESIAPRRENLVEVKANPAPPPIASTMLEANRQISAASLTTLNSVTSSAISNSTQTRNSTVEIGQVTVNSQATDAQGVAKDMNSELSNQLKNLEHESATGVSR